MITSSELQFSITISLWKSSLAYLWFIHNFSFQIENLFENHDFRAKITREEFEEMCKDLFDRVAGPIETAIRSAAMKLVSLMFF